MFGDESLIYAGYALIALVILFIVDAIRDYRSGGKSKLKYSIKRSINGIRPVVHIIFACYAIIGFITVTPSVILYCENYVASATTIDSEIIWRGAGFAWLVFIVYVSVKIWLMGWKEWIKYNEQEKEWRKEAASKNKARLYKMLNAIGITNKKLEV